MTEPGQPRYQPEPGNGLQHGVYKRIVCGFDDETFAEIRQRAVAQKTSFAEQVRLLCEWGLEAETTVDQHKDSI